MTIDLPFYYIIATRRNKWICALKNALADVKIYGPKGNPKAPPPPDRYTLVPWDDVKQQELQALQGETATDEAVEPVGGYQLSDKNAAISGYRRFHSLRRSL